MGMRKKGPVQEWVRGAVWARASRKDCGAAPCWPLLPPPSCSFQKDLRPRKASAKIARSLCRCDRGL